MAEINMAHCTPRGVAATEPSMLLEVTSSGMTHAWGFVHWGMQWMPLFAVLLYGMVCC